MKRLTISSDACIEALSLLITMAWADDRLEDHEKEGVRAAAGVFNLTKELRERLDSLLQKPLPVEELLIDTLSPKDKAFMFVAAAWLSGVDDDVDEKEKQLLDKAASLLGISAERRAELEQIARDLEPLRKDKKSWADEIVALFKAIPARLEGESGDNIDVAFE
jgi:uncharacterized tellurite resistance protein B-like protein